MTLLIDFSKRGIELSKNPLRTKLIIDINMIVEVKYAISLAKNYDTIIAYNIYDFFAIYDPQTVPEVEVKESLFYAFLNKERLDSLWPKLTKIELPFYPTDTYQKVITVFDKDLFDKLVVNLLSDPDFAGIDSIDVKSIFSPDTRIIENPLLNEEDVLSLLSVDSFDYIRFKASDSTT